MHTWPSWSPVSHGPRLNGGSFGELVGGGTGVWVEVVAVESGAEVVGGDVDAGPAVEVELEVVGDGACVGVVGAVVVVVGAVVLGEAVVTVGAAVGVAVGAAVGVVVGVAVVVVNVDVDGVLLAVGLAVVVAFSDSSANTAPVPGSCRPATT